MGVGLHNGFTDSVCVCCSLVCGPIGRSKVLHVFLFMFCQLLLWRAPVAPHDYLNILSALTRARRVLKIGLSVLVPKSRSSVFPNLSLYFGAWSL